MFWSVDDCIPQEVEYILSVNSSLSSAPMDYTTNSTNMTLLLRCGIQYNLTVTAQLCDGNVMSNPSDPLPVFFSGNYNYAKWALLHKYLFFIKTIR